MIPNLNNAEDLQGQRIAHKFLTTHTKGLNFNYAQQCHGHSMQGKKSSHSTSQTQAHLTVPQSQDGNATPSKERRGMNY